MTAPGGDHRRRRYLRFAYPVTAAYLTIMVTLIAILLMSGTTLQCGCR